MIEHRGKSPPIGRQGEYFVREEKNGRQCLHGGDLLAPIWWWCRGRSTMGWTIFWRRIRLSSQVLPIICTWQLFLYFSYQNTQILSNLEKKNYYHKRPGTTQWSMKRHMSTHFLFTARTYLQVPLRQWGASNVYLLVLSSWKVNITKNPNAAMGL